MDNTTRIAEIRAKLEAGATSVVVDGVAVTLDFAELRRELRRLEATDDTIGNKRPVAASIYLGGFGP